eukprot:2170300-Prymnesium_polylepis.1
MVTEPRERRVIGDSHPALRDDQGLRHRRWTLVLPRVERHGERCRSEADASARQEDEEQHERDEHRLG